MNNVINFLANAYRLLNIGFRDLLSIKDLAREDW